jgi:hypothetical protein
MTPHQHVSHRTKCVEIAPNVCLQPTSHSNAPVGVVLNTPEADAYGDHFAGFIVGHDRPGFDVRCEGYVNLDDCAANADRPRWTMAGSLEGGDLTLSPSVLCRLGNVANEPCGFHGFVRDGTWVSA